MPIVERCPADIMHASYLHGICTRTHGGVGDQSMICHLVALLDQLSSQDQFGHAHLSKARTCLLTASTGMVPLYGETGQSKPAVPGSRIHSRMWDASGRPFEYLSPSLCNLGMFTVSGQSVPLCHAIGPCAISQVQDYIVPTFLVL